MNRSSTLALILGPLCLWTFVLADESAPRAALRIENSFKTPEETVSYYCARDAEGFVWSGLLDSERKAFTTWKSSPSVENFKLARSYRIGKPEMAPGSPDKATVLVRYELIATQEPNGGTSPTQDPVLEVRYELDRIEGRWKISKPDPSQVSAIVVEGKLSPLVSSRKRD